MTICSLPQSDSYQLMITQNVDLSIRFYDLSEQLLNASSPLRFEYPQPIPYLTIDVGQLLRNSTLSSIFAHEKTAISIQSIHFSGESLECLVTLSSGAVLVYYFAEGGLKPAADSLDALIDLETSDDSLIPLSDLANWGADSFRPVCILDTSRGLVTQVAVSEVGATHSNTI